LRSEMPSGMCAKLRTVAASNNRNGASQSLLLLLARSRYVYNGIFLHAHPVRGESHNQLNAKAEAATRLSVCYNKELFIKSKKVKEFKLMWIL